MAQHTLHDLKQMQALPISIKLRMTEQRIRDWVYEYGEDGVYVSFSGGKDSTVLLDIVRNRMGLTSIPAVFVDTGLEFPEIRAFIKKFDNVEWLKPDKNFKKVIEMYGYPFISKEISAIVGGAQKSLTILKNDGIDISDKKKVISEVKKRYRKEKGEWRRLAQCYGCITTKNEIVLDPSDDEKGRYSDIPQKYKFLLSAPFYISNRCCDVMKKTPVHMYEKRTGRHPITAQMTEESKMRERQWLDNGCNGFQLNHPISNPMSFWTEQDILHYIKQNNIEICSVYGDIVPVQEDSKQISFEDIGAIPDNRKLKTTGMRRTGCMFCGFGCHLEQEGEERFRKIKETHPNLYEWIMKPKSKGGLGFKEIIDWLNENGDLNIRY